VIGDVPSGAVRQWRRWCLDPITCSAPSRRARAYASAEYDVLGLTFPDDELLLEAGSKLLHSGLWPSGRLPRARARQCRPATDRALRLLPAAVAAALWPLVAGWMRERCP
jgi:predicted alpha/beta hydrolase